MTGEKHTAFIEISSCHEEKSLAELVREAYSNQLIFFECGIGKHNKQWYRVKKGDTIIYMIDGVTVCKGEVILKIQRVYKPTFGTEHDDCKTFSEFAKEMCPRNFCDDDWLLSMEQKHAKAISENKLLFVVFAIVKTECLFQANKCLLLDKIAEMEQAEADMASVGIYSLNE